MNRLTRNAFTLIELLVVIAIIAILIGMLLPAVQKVREAASRLKCQNNLKQLGIALHHHSSDFDRFPMGCINDPGVYHGAPRISWLYFILPYIEQQNIYDKFDTNASPTSGAVWADNPNSVGPGAPCSIVISSLICPSDDGPNVDPYRATGIYAKGNYLAFFGGVGYDNGLSPTLPQFSAPASKQAVFGINIGARIVDIRDGSSSTMMLGEYLRGVVGFTSEQRGNYWCDEPGGSQIYANFKPNTPNPDKLWPGFCLSKPERNLPCEESYKETAASRSRHSQGVNILLADGAVRFVNQAIDLSAWQALVTSAEGEVIGDF